MNNETGSEQSNEFHFVVDDNGHSHHKLAWFSQNGIKVLKVPTIIGDGSAGITDQAGLYHDTYEVGGQRFVCNPQIQRPVDLRNASYQMSRENKALIAHAIHLAGLADQQIILGTTLPWSQCFQKDGTPNKGFMEQVGQYYSSSGEKVRNLANQKEITIIHAKPYTEGLSAFFDWAVGDNGDIHRVSGLRGPVAVIDLGGSTTDITTVLSGSSSLNVDHSRSGTRKIGVLDAKSQVATEAAKSIRETASIDPEADGGIPDWMLQSLFETGKASIGAIGGVDISDRIQTIKRNVAAEILQFIKTTVGNLLAYQAIIFVGGGAIVFRDVLEELCPTAEFLDEFANARGALKYMTYIDARGLQQAAASAVAEVA